MELLASDIKIINSFLVTFFTLSFLWIFHVCSQHPLMFCTTLQFCRIQTASLTPYSLSHTLSEMLDITVQN